MRQQTAASEKNTKLWAMVCLILGAATAATFTIKEASGEHLWSVATAAKIVLYVLFLATLLVLVKGVPQLGKNYRSLPVGVQRLIVILPLLAVIFALINAAFPEVSWLVRMNDDDIFRRPGALLRTVLELVSCAYFITLIPQSIKKRHWLPALTLLIIGVVLFVMGMEEISWGQRIFEWRTTGYFAKHNVQGETNLHNLATQLFQNTLFFGGFILLVVLPFFHDQLERLLHRAKRFRYLVDFLPESWMILAFGAGLMFTDPLIAIYGVRWDSILFQLLATLVLLGALLYRLHRDRNELYHTALLTFMCALVVLVLSLCFSSLWLVYNQGLPTEYLKIYIIVGIFCWAIGVRRKLKVA